MGVVSGRGMANPTCARPSGVTRMRCGWSQPSTSPWTWAASAAAASGTIARAAVSGRSSPVETASARLRPGTHSVTATPSTSRGRPPAAGVSTSSRRAQPRCSKLPDRRARLTISSARSLQPGSAPAESRPSRRSTVTATSRCSTVSTGLPELGAGRGIGADAGGEAVPTCEHRADGGAAGRLGAVVLRGHGGRQARLGLLRACGTGRRAHQLTHRSDLPRLGPRRGPEPTVTGPRPVEV